MQAAERLRRAEAARSLCENKLFIEAFETVRDTLVSAWVHTKPEDAAAREMAWLQLQALHQVRSHLVAVVADRDAAKAEIERLERRPTRVV